MHLNSSEKRKNNMSKIDGAIYEIHYMDTVADRDQWVNRIHPLVKLLLTILYIAVTVSFSKYDLSGVLLMGIYPAVIFILGEISFRDSIRRLRVVLPLVCFVGLFNPFFDQVPVAQVGSLVITSGMISMVTLMIKGVYSVLASYLLIATTSIEKICYAMRLLKIPSVVVTQIQLTYRYVTVLLGEASRIMQAYSLRAPGQKGVHFKVWGSLAGQLLLRSMDKANAVYESMILRGYKGEFAYASRTKCRAKDYLYFVVWVAIFAVLKIL